MIRKNMKLAEGQNLRYTGKGFSGYIKGQPYMIYIATHSIYQIQVKYNGVDMVVDKYFTDLVG
ncbi:hypothetical protein [Mucilaginibacter ginsenosidivorans]|uniref:Uncharacterized protein n=1 Tax=Mucilaginibacter ginsenosidivorans TaxID=398053 RepID=A0A5B8V065_9SPHI|nr:hypothetical protein [Mucilaginibacter ginsenosidivorans]QEC64011.1 hypothetical protein FRZ54_15985 [Mucilaginibacter ginsenosidivorans]